MSQEVIMNQAQIDNAIDLGEITKVEFKCVSCSRTSHTLYMGKIETPHVPFLCSPCQNSLAAKMPSTPLAVIGRYGSGSSFMDGFVDR